MQEEQQQVAHAFEHAKLQELMSKAMANIARAREDHSRSESNLGLYEERISMIQRNQAMTLKEKQAALTSLLENIQKFGEIETNHTQLKLDQQQQQTMMREEQEKRDVEMRTESNKFLEQILGSVLKPNQQQPQQEQMAGQNLEV
jgi:hypothetical protein